MNKNSPEEDAINCLVVGTEQKFIYIIDSEAFTILATVSSLFFNILTIYSQVVCLLLI